MRRGTCAIAAAIAPSVTVSIGELTTGISNRMLRVSCVLRSTYRINHKEAIDCPRECPEPWQPRPEGPLSGCNVWILRPLCCGHRVCHHGYIQETTCYSCAKRSNPEGVTYSFDVMLFSIVSSGTLRQQIFANPNNAKAPRELEITPDSAPRLLRSLCDQAGI